MKVSSCFHILIATVLWSTLTIFYRALTNMGFDPGQVVTIRMALSASSLFLFCLLPKQRFPKIKIKHWWIFAGTGIASFALSNYTYFISMDLGAISVSSVLMNSAPVFIMLLSSVCFKDRLTKQKLTALGVSLLGCLIASGLLSGHGQAVSLASVGFGILSAFFYSLYSIFATFAVIRGYDSLTISAYTFLFASLGTFPLSAHTFPSLDKFPSGWIWPALGISVFSTVLPYFLYTVGLTKVEPGIASVIATLEVVFTNLVGILLFHEPLSLEILLGIACIVTAVFILGHRPDIHKKETA